MADKKDKTIFKKEPEYPIWQGPDNAEKGVIYRSEKSGNLIQLGDTPDNG